MDTLRNFSTKNETPPIEVSHGQAMADEFKQRGYHVKTLEQSKLMAQRSANQQNKPMAVINLNRYSPLYVVREHLPTHPMTDAVVFIAHPSTIDQGG
jgi:hypothetical protein